jgi:AraC-like DNA-binding protein
LFAELPRTRQAEAAALAAGFASLVKGLLLTAPSAGDSRELDAARHLAMRRYVEEHLGDPQLGVASLCAAFGASRATIYRDFAEDGGVAHFVIRRRLERAFRDLASGPPDRGRVRQVAERWGFACPYHFSRAFRRQFDLWPSEVFEAGRPAVSAARSARAVDTSGALAGIRPSSGA